MVGKLLYRKWGTYTDEKTGEVKSYDKIVVCGIMTNQTSYNGHNKSGFLEDEYSIEHCPVTSEELEEMYGKTVIIDFDQVVGKKNPVAVAIRLADENGG